MRELAPACPPGASVSSTTTSSPSEAPYTAAARPAGPAPTISTSRTRVPSTGAFRARHSAISWVLGSRTPAATRRRQPRRPGSHDQHVAHPRAVDGRVQGEALGDLVVARVAQDGRPAADQDRDVGHADTEPVQQLLHS